MEEQQRVRNPVQSFLTIWLVNQNIDNAELSFASSAYGNEAMLQASCAGYIKPEDRASEAARRTGIQKFLRDFIPTNRVASLNELLNRDAILPIMSQLGITETRRESDPFVVAKLTRGQIPTEESWQSDYLQKNLPSAFYASFVPLNQGLIYFLWVPEANDWRIYHASIVCI